MTNAAYKTYKVEDIFSVRTSKGIDSSSVKLGIKSELNCYPFIGRTKTNYGIQGYIVKQGFEPNPKDVFSVSQIGSVHSQFRNEPWYSSQNMFVLEPIKKEAASVLVRLFIETALNKTLNRYADSYTSYPTLNSLRELPLDLPALEDGSPDFDYMADYISSEKSKYDNKIQAYLKVTGLNDTTLTETERGVLSQTPSFKEFKLEELFGASKRGKRLKSFDRIDGELPFVTAGESESGISAYIGNEVDIFNENSITIDMFGSAKYRGYKFGADDHVAIVDTTKLSRLAAMYVTAAIHKATSDSGKYSYSRNFYASDADTTIVSLPITPAGDLDTDYMENYIRATQKNVIENLVRWNTKNVEALEKVIA